MKMKMLVIECNQCDEVFAVKDRKELFHCCCPFCQEGAQLDDLGYAELGEVELV
jgi:hypothetical protein